MKYLFMRLFLVAVVAIGWVLPAFGDSGGHSGTIPQLTVRGESILNVPADQMLLTVGVVTSALSADAALEQNTKKMREVKKALSKLGLTADEYRTGQFQVQPQWEPRPRQPVQDWQPRIVGYRVTNSLKITTGKLDLAGRIIEASIKAGANDIGSISFGLADPRRDRADAIKLATANAQADALSLAEAASVKLVKILSARLDEAVASPQTIRFESYGESALARAGSAPGITPGEVVVRASVTLIYQLAED